MIQPRERGVAARSVRWRIAPWHACATRGNVGRMKEPDHGTSSSGKPPRPVTREQIAALAHAIWQDRGCPEGSDLGIWLEAERQLQGKAADETTADPIPANPAEPGDPDLDPALRPKVKRELDRFGPRADDRASPTSL